jgi:hypothetical protein
MRDCFFGKIGRFFCRQKFEMLFIFFLALSLSRLALALVKFKSFHSIHSGFLLLLMMMKLIFVYSYSGPRNSFHNLLLSFFFAYFFGIFSFFFFGKLLLINSDYFFVQAQVQFDWNILMKVGLKATRFVLSNSFAL